MRMARHNIVMTAVAVATSAILQWGLLSARAEADDMREELKAGEIAAITAGTAAALLAGTLSEKSAKGDPPRWNSAFGFEASLQRTLGGRYYPDKTNFLDGTTGSAYTAVGGLAVLLAADLAWTDDETGSVAGQDVFLYATGIAATKGVTSIAKGIVRRARPMITLEPELARQRTNVDTLFDNQSFFSGHASSAFFASTFLNLRLRAIMRQEMSFGDYRNWRWAPPCALFGWASFVGWSRIQSYEHFFLDVVAGAATGVLMAELFYSFQEESDLSADQAEGAAGHMIQVTVRF